MFVIDDVNRGAFHFVKVSRSATNQRPLRRRQKERETTLFSPHCEYIRIRTNFSSSWFSWSVQ